MTFVLKQLHLSRPKRLSTLSSHPILSPTLPVQKDCPPSPKRLSTLSSHPILSPTLPAQKDCPGHIPPTTLSKRPCRPCRSLWRPSMVRPSHSMSSRRTPFATSRSRSRTRMASHRTSSS